MKVFLYEKISGKSVRLVSVRRDILISPQIHSRAPYKAYAERIKKRPPFHRTLRFIPTRSPWNLFDLCRPCKLIP